MSDYEKIEEDIKQRGYIPKTSMENVINMVFAYFDVPEIEELGYERFNEDGFLNVNECIQYVEESGGYSEFDFYC